MEVRLFCVQEVKVLLLDLASVPGVFCCQQSQCLVLPKCPGDKRAAVLAIPFMFLGKSCIEPGSSVSCADVPLPFSHDAVRVLTMAVILQRVF